MRGSQEALTCLNNLLGRCSPKRGIWSGLSLAFTLPQIEGQGICLETVPQTHQSLGNQISNLSKGDLALLLGIGEVATGIGTGTAPLIQGSQLAHLQSIISADPEALETPSPC